MSTILHYGLSLSSLWTPHRDEPFRVATLAITAPMYLLPQAPFSETKDNLCFSSSCKTLRKILPTLDLGRLSLNSI